MVLVSSSDIRIRVRVDLQLKRREHIIQGLEATVPTPPHSTKIPLSKISPSQTSDNLPSMGDQSGVD